MKLKTCLVVDDSHADQILIAGLLSIGGFNVVPIYTSEAAWQWLKTHTPPQLILLDIVMRQGEACGLAFVEQFGKLLSSARLQLFSVPRNSGSKIGSGRYVREQTTI